MLKLRCARIEPRREADAALRRAAVSVVTLTMLDDSGSAELMEVSRDFRILVRVTEPCGLTAGVTYTLTPVAE